MRSLVPGRHSTSNRSWIVPDETMPQLYPPSVDRRIPPLYSKSRNSSVLEMDAIFTCAVYIRGVREQSFKEYHTCPTTKLRVALQNVTADSCLKFSPDAPSTDNKDLAHTCKMPGFFNEPHTGSFRTRAFANDCYTIARRAQQT